MITPPRVAWGAFGKGEMDFKRLRASTSHEGEPLPHAHRPRGQAQRGRQRDALPTLREVMAVSLCRPTECFLAGTGRSDGGWDRGKPKMLTTSG